MKNQAAGDGAETAKTPVHAVVYARLRDRILYGDLAPGQAVTIQGLAADLGAGLTPVREAIRRLISDGALVFTDTRRVRVPELTATDLDELIFIRKTIEPELARRAATRIGATDLAELRALDNTLDRAILSGDVSGYLTWNHRFHAALYDGAGAPIMAALAHRAWLRFGPSLRVVCGRLGTQNLPDRHKEMLSALAASDADGAAEAMRRDVEQGMDLIAGLLVPVPVEPRFD